MGFHTNLHPGASYARIMESGRRSKPSSPLTIATASLSRLVKDQASYHQELVQQQQRLEKLRRKAADDGEGEGEGDDDAHVDRENLEWEIKQTMQAIKETEALFPRLKTQTEEAAGRLETLIAAEDQQQQQQQETEGQDKTSDVEKAKEVLASARSSS